MKPAISRSVVVLPQPDGPSRQTSWPLRCSARCCPRPSGCRSAWSARAVRPMPLVLPGRLCAGSYLMAVERSGSRNQITLLSRRLAISASEKPNSRKTSWLCSPRSGGGATRRLGVRASDMGWPITCRFPAHPPCRCPARRRDACTCGSANTLSIGVDHAARHAGRIQALDPVRAGAVGEIAVDRGIERVAVLRARGAGGILAHCPCSAGAPIALHRRFHISPPAVAMLMWPSRVLKTPVGMLVGWLLPACAGTSPVDQPARSLEVEHEDLRLQQRGGDLWPLPDCSRSSSATRMPERAEQAGGQIGDRNADPHRPASRLARDRHQPAEPCAIWSTPGRLGRARPGRSRRCWRRRGAG